MKKILVVMFLACCVFSQKGTACDYCMLSQGASPLQANGLSLRLDMRYLALNSLYDNNKLVANTYNQKETYFTTQLSAIIPIFDNGSILLSAPLTSRASNANVAAAVAAGAEVDPTASGFGIGDATAMFRYRFMDYMDGTWTIMTAASAGIKVPTGYTNVRNSIGDFADAHIQLGSGSFDPLAGVNFFAGIGDWGMTANVLAWFPGKGVRGYQFGNILNYDIDAVYHLFSDTFVDPAFFVGAGIGGEWHGKESTNGVYDDNTGGNTLYVSPIVRVMFSEWSVEAGAQIPFDHNLNGTQLGDTYRLTMGVQYQL